MEPSAECGRCWKLWHSQTEYKNLTFSVPNLTVNYDFNHPFPFLFGKIFNDLSGCVPYAFNHPFPSLPILCPSRSPVLVALDGRCGSGKTTLAAQLARQFPQSITVHTDDFYLPPGQPCGKLGADPLRQHGLGAPASPGAHPRPGRAGRPPTVPTPAGRVPTCRNNALRPSRWSSWRAVTAATPPLRTVMI